MKSLLEAIFLGFVTMIIGKVIHHLSIQRLDKYEKEVYKKTRIMEISFFIIGLILHMLLENCGFNSWYCKKCDFACIKRIPSIN
tara:strand:+ start:822 stop:1073 length:252 start_codon:yes stop_codon:yes gene_type:complete